jgi:hypothetical protein
VGQLSAASKEIDWMPAFVGMMLSMGFAAKIGSNVVPAKAGTQSAFESLACPA